MILFRIKSSLSSSISAVSMSNLKAAFSIITNDLALLRRIQYFSSRDNAGLCFELFSRHSSANSKVFCCVLNFSACFFNSFQFFCEIVVEIRCVFKIVHPKLQTFFRIYTTSEVELNDQYA